MRYPNFLKQGDTIGICAPSAGVGRKLERYDFFLSKLQEEGYKIKESASVRVNNVRSATARKRGAEFNETISDKDVDMLLCASGGDFMLEMLPYVDFDLIDQNPKWISGMSDPTNILFTVTTKLDIATLYGHNASYNSDNPKPDKMFFSYLKGDLRVQKSYQKYVSFINSINEETVYESVRWLSKKQQKISGRLIGGCIEVIDKLIGTDFDYTNSFIERYRNDGIVWYFDIFNMSAYDFYITLLQFKNAGWFRHCKGVLVGRPAFPRVEDEKLNYEKALDKALGQIPHICEMDIGHTDPSMTLINGALIDVEYNDGKGKIRFRLK